MKCPRPSRTLARLLRHPPSAHGKARLSGLDGTTGQTRGRTGLPERGRGAPVEEVSPRSFPPEAPRDRLSCHARRPEGTGAVRCETAAGGASPPRHPEGKQGAELLLAGGAGAALVPRPHGL